MKTQKFEVESYVESKRKKQVILPVFIFREKYV